MAFGLMAGFQQRFLQLLGLAVATISGGAIGLGRD